MPFVNIKESNLAGSLGNIIGKMQGELSSKISTSVMELESSFENGSPDERKLRSLKNKRNNLVKRTQGFNRRLKKLEKIPKTILRITPALKVILRVLKNLPIPTSVPPGIGVPLAVTNKYADLLHKIKELIKQAEQDATALEAILKIEGGIGTLVEGLTSQLDTADQLVEFAMIENEIKKLPLSEQKEKGFVDDDGIYISSKLMPLLISGDRNEANKLLEGLDADFKLGEKADNVGFGNDNRFYYRGPNGDLYELAIIEDEKSPSYAKKRYAVAKTPTGAVVLKGQSSFSADTDILLEEIKFRIDNQLP